MEVEEEVDMIRYLIMLMALNSGVYSAELAVPELQLDKNAIDIKLDGRRPPLTVCSARLVFPDKDGTGVSAESYLVQYNYGYPMIADRIDGFSVRLELRDISGDGQRELLALFHAGANSYGVKVYRVSKEIYRPAIYPLMDQPITSNMGSIKFLGGEIHILVQTMLADGTAEYETMRYKLDGDRIKLVGSTKKILP